jgi:hypothetical protein
MRVAERQHGVAQCGRQDGGVSPALPALHAAFSSTATFFTSGSFMHLRLASLDLIVCRFPVFLGYAISAPWFSPVSRQPVTTVQRCQAGSKLPP